MLDRISVDYYEKKKTHRGGFYKDSKRTFMHYLDTPVKMAALDKNIQQQNNMQTAETYNTYFSSI